MRFHLSRAIYCAGALLIASAANAQTQVPNVFQAGQPAVADDVNANFTELESAANQSAADIVTNAADVATNAADIAALDISTQASADDNANSVADLEADTVDQERRMRHLEDDMDLVLDRVIPCGEYKVYGCIQSTSADGSVFDHNWFAGGIYNIIYFRDPLAAVQADSLFFAIPIALLPNSNQFDFDNLWIGGSSNITRTLDGVSSPVLVDDCDNPTVELVPTGEPVSSRMVVTSGNYYRHMPDGALIETIDVSGLTYGLLNPQTPGNIIEICTLVTDQTGLYDVYPIELKFNVFDGRYDSPWTHQ